MAIKIGNIDATYKVGGNDCSIYLGNTLLYPLGFRGKIKLEYNGGQQVYSAACDSSTDLTSGETNPSGYEASAMTDAVIGDYCVTTIDGYAFAYCSGLTSVTIPNSVTSIGNSCFYYCTGLTSIDIPSGVTSIGDNAFGTCSSLSSATIGNGVTTIDSRTFNYCTHLAFVTIGSGVTNFGTRVFYNCNNLESITINAIVPPTLSNNALEGVPRTTRIYVPQGSVESYKQANGWSDRSSKIEAINN